MVETKEPISQRTDSRPGPIRNGFLGAVFAAAFLAGLFLISVISVRSIDHSKPEDWLKEQMTYLPSGKYLKPMTLGFTEAAASLLWVNGVLYFGESYLTGQSYRWMNHILDIVTTLNPRFKEAYSFGSTILTKDKDEIERTLPLIDRGLEQFPLEWQWRVAAALARVKMDSNLLAAAEYLKPLDTLPNVPSYLHGLLARFLKEGGGESVAIDYLVRSYLEARNPIQRQIFTERLVRLQLGTDLDSASLSQEVQMRTTWITAVLQKLESAPNDAPQAMQMIQEILNRRNHSD